jgi:hypothetical protein
MLTGCISQDNISKFKSLAQFLTFLQCFMCCNVRKKWKNPALNSYPVIPTVIPC